MRCLKRGVVMGATSGWYRGVTPTSRPRVCSEGAREHRPGGQRRATARHGGCWPYLMNQDIEALGEPSGGWGSLKSVTSVLVREHVALAGTRVLAHQNKPDGFACVS